MTKKGYKQTPEHIAKVHSPESRAKISATLKGVPKPRRSPEHRIRHAAALRGNKLSEEHKQRIASGVTQWLLDAGYPQSPTYLEYALQLLLEDAGYEYEAQKKIGRSIVDFYVFSHNLVFEADGSFWHQDKVRELKRDTRLIKQGVAAVVHLDEVDLAPWRAPIE